VALAIAVPVALTCHGVTGGAGSAVFLHDIDMIMITANVAAIKG
jgi:hypothetical protein